MHAKRRRPRIPLPKSWPRHIKLAVLHTISLAHYAIVRVRGRAAGSAASQERLNEECALLHEEMRIKDLRMAQIPAHKRPRYRPHERMAILEIRAARGWSLKQTADTFLITEATVSSWMRRIDEGGRMPSCSFLSRSTSSPTLSAISCGALKSFVLPWVR